MGGCIVHLSIRLRIGGIRTSHSNGESKWRNEQTARRRIDQRSHTRDNLLTNKVHLCYVILESGAKEGCFSNRFLRSMIVEISHLESSPRASPHGNVRSCIEESDFCSVHTDRCYLEWTTNDVIKLTELRSTYPRTVLNEKFFLLTLSAGKSIV